MSRKKKKPRGWIHPRKRMWIRQKYRCPICGNQIRSNKLFTREVNIDHIIPRAHGGTSTPGNLQLTHTKCNQLKGASCAGCPTCYQTEDE